MKYVIGIAIGLVAALILPVNSPHGQEVLDFILNIVIRFGRFILLPLLFFSVATACYKLKEEKRIFKIGAWTVAVIVVTSVILVVLGMLSALIVKLPPIPISVEKVSDIPTLDIKSLITRIFPYSGFQALLEGAYLLPCFIIAGLMGAGASSEKMYGKPGINLFDSMSHICYNVMSFFAEILSVGMIAIMCKWSLEFFALQKAKVFMPLIILLTVDHLIVALVIYPLLTGLICHEKKPYKILYASICPFLVGFFSGDTNLTLPLLMKHGKESLGIKRRANAAVFPLFSIFGRGGAALVQAICFVQIFRSYSLLNIDGKVALWIGGMSFLLSFVLADHSSGGPFFAITIMCIAYGPSFEAGYLLLKGVAPIICAFAAGFDVITAMYGSYIVANKSDYIQPVETKKFI